jgi:hypothetical protein
MSAIVGTAVTNVDLVANVFEEHTFTAATNDDATTGGSETFYITPTVPDGEGVIEIYNGCGQSVSCTVLQGDFWMGTADMGAFTVANTKRYVGRVDTAKYLQSDGKIHVKVTPTTTCALNASSKVNISYTELRSATF